MLSKEMVDKIRSISKEMRLWDTPQYLQQCIMEQLHNWQVDYEEVVVLGNIKKCSMFVIETDGIQLINTVYQTEECVQLYQLPVERYVEYTEYWAKMSKTSELLKRLHIPKILLVNVCNTSLRPVPRLNLSTASLASYLRLRGTAVVQIIDMQFGSTLQEVTDAIQHCEPEVVGISIDFMEYEVACSLIQRIRSLYPNIVMVLGNVLPALLPEKFFAVDEQVLISYGEGEEALCDIMRWVQGLLALRQVSGIMYKREQNVYKTPIRYIDMSECQTPALDTALQLKQYKGVLTLETSRGCDYAACTFCPREHKTRFWRCLSPKQILEQLDELVQVAQQLALPKHIYIADEEMIGELPDGTELDRVIQMCEQIIQQYTDLKLDIAVRADSVYNPKKGTEYNIKLIRMWQMLQCAGADRVFVGVESGCLQQLQRYNKGTTPLQNLTAIRILTALGMEVRIGFVMFDPLMTGVEELVENMNFLNRKDAILKTLPEGYTCEELLHNLEENPHWIQTQQLDRELYLNVSYLMTGLEVFVNAPYAYMVRKYEKQHNRQLIYGYDWELGKLQVHYINPNIEQMYLMCKKWVQQNYGLAYTLKSFMKSAEGLQKNLLKSLVLKYRQLTFEFAQELIRVMNIEQHLPQSQIDIPILQSETEMEKVFAELYARWMQGRMRPLIEDIRDQILCGSIQDTDNGILAHVLQDWMQAHSVEQGYI